MKRNLIAMMAAVIYSGKMTALGKVQVPFEDEDALMKDSIREAAKLDSMLMDDQPDEPQW